MSKSIQVAGIDGCKNGWVAVSLSTKGAIIVQEQTFSTFMEHLHGADAILIDMPIGLARNKEEAAHRPEKLARKFIPGKGASIFNAPSEQAAFCTTYGDANAMNHHILGKGLSKQSYHICSKIREVDTYVKRHPSHAKILMESHPEVCFAHLHPDKEPILENKKSPIGQEKRLMLLKSYAPEVVSMVEQTLASSSELRKITDDVIDAACLAIVAKYGIEEGFQTIPETPHENSHGMPMQMVYPH